MAGRLTHVASRILGGNGVGTRSAAATLRQYSGMGMSVIVPDKPLHANDELTWDNGTPFPEPCIDRIAVTVGKANPRSDAALFPPFRSYSLHSAALLSFNCYPSLFHKTMALQNISSRSFSTSSSEDSPAQQASVSIESPPRIKFKRPDKTGRHIMQILNKEAVEEVRAQREIPDIQPGHIIQVKVEVPENKRRVSILKGIVIARRNAGINTTFRLRRLVQGVGIESLFLLYSPNIKEIKVLDKKKVRRAKLYYLRERMNPLKK